MAYEQADQEFLRKLGTRIRKLRERQQFSQETFAVECGLHRTYIASVERGERNISVLNLRRIAHALQTAPAKLLAGP
ncbi:MAG: helix-turn-helix domain-containing protein [Candidatus Sumerlaeaceae bacterium]